MEGSKACTRCGVVKLFSEFWKDTKNKDGRRSVCKACSAAIIAAWRKANTEKVKSYGRAWSKANQEKQKAQRLNWRKANPEKVAELAKIWEKKQTKNATFSYVARMINISASELPYDLYLLKREQILLSRALRELNKATKGLNHEDRNQPDDNRNQSDASHNRQRPRNGHANAA